MSDTIGNFITRIRNAQMAAHDKVDIPSSNMRKGIAEVLKERGFIRDFKTVADNKQGMMRVYLKYTPEGKPLIDTIRRVSRPGLRKYVNVKDLPRVRSGYGVAVLSTSQGVMAAEAAREKNIGGEYLIQVW